jgi:hypothetical protein
MERWVALVLVSLRVIMTQSKEEAVLGRLQQLGLSLCLAECLPSSDNDTPFGQSPLSNTRASSNPEETFARFVGVFLTVVKWRTRINEIIFLSSNCYIAGDRTRSS